MERHFPTKETTPTALTLGRATFFNDEVITGFIATNRTSPTRNVCFGRFKGTLRLVLSDARSFPHLVITFSRIQHQRANTHRNSSAVEHLPHTQSVAGANPASKPGARRTRIRELLLMGRRPTPTAAAEPWRVFT